MNYGFHWTEKSLARNALTQKFEPIQPFIFLAMSRKINACHFIDIGANIGFYSVFMSWLPSISSITAFEASDEAFETLIANIELNDLTTKANCIKKAVSSSSGYVEFQIESELSGINCVTNTSIHNKNLFHERKMVESCTIDGSLKISNSYVAIKIDVEGHEAHVLRGAENFLQKNSCVIQIEIYEDKNKSTHEFLSSIGYKKLFKSKSDYYYSNASELSDSVAVLNTLEEAAEKFIEVQKGNFPKMSAPMSLNASINDGIINAEITFNHRIFNKDVEYAFYINQSGKKIHTQWYSKSPTLLHHLDESLEDKNLSITGFLRETKNHDKKIMIHALVSASFNR